MLKLLSYLESITPDWLNEKLVDNKNYDRILSLKKETIYKSPVTVICRLILNEGQESNTPSSVVIKIKESRIEESKKEIEFYNKISNHISFTSEVICMKAATIKKKSISYILMEDLTETHYTPDFSLPPERHHFLKVADVLAEFHASCWNNNTLLDCGYKLSGEHTQRSYLTNKKAKTKKIVNEFIHFMGDRLTNERIEIYNSLLEYSFNLFDKRFNKKQNLTLVHGDAHFWNFLYPKVDDSNSKIKIIDWEYLDVGVGATELAYTFSLWLFPNQKIDVENEILKQYFSKLIEHGVKNYSWEQCMYDYRLGILQNMFLPCWHWHNKERAELWWNLLERSFLSFHEWNCKDLLRSVENV